MGQCVLQKNWVSILNVKITARAYIIKIWLFLLYLLSCCSVCSQTWFDSTASEAGVSYGKMGLLCSRSRSQQRFKMLVNVCLDDVFWATEHFVIKLDMRMQHHKPECHAEKLVPYLHCHHGPECGARRLVCSLQVQGYNEGSYNQIWLFLPYLLNCWSFFLNQI